jgi:hypothetical protein
MPVFFELSSVVSWSTFRTPSGSSSSRPIDVKRMLFSMISLRSWTRYCSRRCMRKSISRRGRFQFSALKA